jgi:hypothetical protein
MPKSVWTDEFYLRAYELAREGLKDPQIAKALGIDKRTFKQFVKTKVALRNALNKARAGAGSKELTVQTGQTFMDYVYRRLPGHVQDVWSDMRLADKDKNPIRRVEDMLEGCGKRDRQILFIHSLVCSNFNKAEACRKIGLPYATLETWKTKDPDFIELMGYVQEMKRDFVEGALMSLIAQGDSAATIFASKCLNRDRGYDPKTTVEHTGSVMHGVVNMQDVLSSLPAETQRAILNQHRKANNMLPPHDGNEDVEDADYSIVEDGE